MASTTSKAPETPKNKILTRARMSSVSADSPSTPTRETRRSSPVTSTVVSSLSIPVQGAVRVKRPLYTMKDPIIQPGSDRPGRAPRKSKSNAMNALRAHSAASVDPDDPVTETLNEGKAETSTPPQPAPELDMNSVGQKPSRSDMDTKQRPRPFAIPDCPTFWPTEEEFKDPTAYIQKIANIGHEYGICKIIPPESWKMPFVTDTKTFRFKTRVQRLNQIEAASRAKLNFLEQLYRFHKQQSNTRMSIPTINNKPLDLWLLRREVQKLGGYNHVNNKRLWMLVGQRLGYTGIPGLSMQLKNSYTRVILPYEHFSEHVRNSPTLSPSSSRTPKPHLQTHQNIQTSNRIVDLSKEPPNSPPSSPLSNDSNLSDNEDQNGPSKKQGQANGNDRAFRSIATNGLPSTSIADPSNRAGEVCEICQKSNKGEEMLLCDGCDCGFHIFCLDPPLSSIPKGQWFCHVCLFGAGEEFGFDEGEEHSLSSFQARDDGFRTMWFEKHKPPKSDETEWSKTKSNLTISENFMEQQFWQLVQSPNETVEVEYGADVHSTTHGSAMPTLESHPLDPYSKDPWNLNNLPIAADSLLRYIKSDISGMTVPWTYVGMTFSTFCWHNEDHYTYSVNFMHWGETKTWYGIPGKSADRFEAAMKREAPDLFDAQPDLLFQLVTLMSPCQLTENNVPVYACDQRPGEFVITFPKAYHAGFNHGFNFNEAVNFALPDWLPFDKECVQRYREHRKHPVFSHDELLVTIAQYSPSIKASIWLSESLRDMKERELRQREHLRSEFPNLLQKIESEAQEDQVQCAICNAYCYLSQVVCQCGPKILCVEHAFDHRNCSTNPLSLRMRLSDTALQDLVVKVDDRASLPANWRKKFRGTLEASALPSLRSMRALLAEGERISYTLPELETLRTCVSKANEWVDVANSLIARKQHRKRNRKSKPGKGDLKSEILEDSMDRPDRTIPDVYRLLDDVKWLGFDSPEITSLGAVVRQAEELKIKASEAYKNFKTTEDPGSHLTDCEGILTEGSSMNIYVEELFELERVVLQHRLLQEISELDDNAITLDEVRHLIARARACEIPDDHPQISGLLKRHKAGNDWEQKAAQVLEQPFKTIEELAEFENPETSIPVDPTVLEKLRAAHAKAVEFERQALAWLHPEDPTDVPKLQDVLRLAIKAEKEFSIPAVRELRRTANFASDLEARCESVLRNRFRPIDEDTVVFDTIREWVQYSKEHLSERFQLPNFKSLIEQLAAHERWLERLPWYCKQHKGLHVQQVLADVIASTEPNDDMPPNDEYFTCICPEPVRPPPLGGVSDAVQCDHCFARFHGVCARRGGSCPFCDIHHWNGALRKERSYHFCYLPSLLNGAPELTKNYSEDWSRLETIVSRVDRLMQLVGAFLSYACQPQHQKAELLPQVRHYMRKLFRIGFAVAPSPDVSYGLDLAGLHCILAIQSPAVKPRKRRRPKFTFGQDVDMNWTDGTRCVCRGRTSYLRDYPTVSCELCDRSFHCGCVFYKINPLSTEKRLFQCPLCLLRKNRPYPNAEVRVKYIEDIEPVYVDVRACLETFSKDLIKITLPPPTVNTVFLDLIRFTPGCPERSTSNSSPNGKIMVSANGRPVRPHEDHSTSLARALVAPQTTNEHNASPRGLKRRLSMEDGDRSSPPNQRHRMSDAWGNGQDSHTGKFLSHLGTLTKTPPTSRKDSDDPIQYNQPSVTLGARPSNPTLRTQSPTIRKIKLVVKPIQERDVPS